MQPSAECRRLLLAVTGDGRGSPSASAGATHAGYVQRASHAEWNFLTTWSKTTHHGVALVDGAPGGLALVAGRAGDGGNGLPRVHLHRFGGLGLKGGDELRARTGRLVQRDTANGVQVSWSACPSDYRAAHRCAHGVQALTAAHMCTLLGRLYRSAIQVQQAPRHTGLLPRLRTLYQPFCSGLLAGRADTAGTAGPPSRGGRTVVVAVKEPLAA